VKFFYDGNMSGSRDEIEPFLSPVVKGYQQSQDGCYYVPEGKETRLYITGKAPNGKDLLNATLDWPMGVNLLPQITVGTTKTREIGLVDGFCSSPIRPEEWWWDPYNYYKNTENFMQHIKELNLYPPYCLPGTKPDAEPNYYWYGYCNHWNPKARHRAIDIAAREGTDVHAPVPGRVVEGNYDHIIGIRGPYGQVDLNHINIIVRYGQWVNAGDIIGKVGPDLHVHMEIYQPLNALSGSSIILQCFSGILPSDILRSPLRGEDVHPLPYFGP